MIYLDYNGSTPVDPRVRDAMLPYLERHFGNPSAGHVAGLAQREAVQRARASVAELIGAEPSEVVFTGSGTESNNWVIKGVAHTRRAHGRRIVVSAVEHPSILNPCRFLQELGCEIDLVPVDGTGMIDLSALERALRRDTILVSVMHANNEVGTVQPIAEVARLARRVGAWVHTDAAQSLGKIPAHVGELDVDFLSIAGHKLYAPQGVGALYLRKGISIEPLLHGASQEEGRRAGTLAVANIVGLGKAAELARTSGGDKLRALRDRLHDGLSRVLGQRLVLNGHPTARLPNTLNVGFLGRIGSELLAGAPDICATTGAACHSGRHEPSAVLKAMNVSPEAALGAVRFSVGRFTTEEEIVQAIRLLVSVLQ